MSEEATDCGGVIQTTPYIGHPAYKSMGGRAAYTLATALFVGGAGVIGYFGPLQLGGKPLLHVYNRIHGTSVYTVSSEGPPWTGTHVLLYPCPTVGFEPGTP